MGLAERDGLLSFLLRQGWPHEPLLNAVNLATNLDVLDVGAGEGRLLNLLALNRHHGKRVGLDPQPGPGVQQGHAEELPFADQSFDAVFMVRMLTHCTNPVQALTEARRVLRPAGQCIVAVQGKEHLQALWAQAGRTAPTRGAEDEVQDILCAAGLIPRRQELRLSLSLNYLDAVDLLGTYGLSAAFSEASFPLTDTLHLILFRA